MNALAMKRIIKGRLSGNEGKLELGSKKFSFAWLPLTIFVFSLLFFCIVQLASVTILSPKGKELQNLNLEKEYLLEENRALEQEIAQMSSLTVVKGRAEKDLGMQQAQEVVYINGTDIQASNTK